MASYITVPQLVERKDVREIGDLVSDDNTQVPYSALTANTNLATAIADASGDIESALLVGGRYTTDDLEGLTGNAASYLQRICAEITMYYLLARRPHANRELFEHYQGLREQYLGSLKRGENIFGLDATINATKAQVDGPTTAEYNDLNLWRDRATPGYFPRRHLPDNR